MSLGHAFKSNLALFCICLFWGTTYLAIAEAVESFPPALMVATRFTLAGSVLLGILLLRGHRLPRERQEWWRIGVVAFFNLMLGNVALAWAEQEVESGLATVLITTFPFWFVGLSAAFGGERVRPLSWVGMAVGFSGIIVLFVPDLANLHARRGPIYYISVLAIILTCVSWGWGSHFAKTRVPKTPKVMVLALQTLLAGLGLIPVGIARGELRGFAPTLESCLWVGYLIVFGSWVAYGSFLWLLDHMPAARIAIHAYINPIVGIYLGWLVRGEDFGPWRIAGSCVILAGVYLVNAASRVDKPFAAPVSETLPEAA